MKYRQLGRNGPRVSAIGLGRGSQPVRVGEPLEKEFNGAIHRAIELGVTLFDSSDSYWSARHEELLGRALKDHRGHVKIASKFGNMELPDGTKLTNGRPEFVQNACEASLRRLGVESIDVYYLHRVDPATPIEETIGAMARLIEQGKVRHLGICEAGPETLRRAHAAHPLVALQTEYSLWFRDIERDMLPVCRELGIAYVAYAPLGRGLLTGRIKTVGDLPVGDRRRRHPRFTAENLAHNTGLVRQLEAVAAAREVPPAQVAIAWLLAQGDDIVPIPGTNHVKNLEQNVAAVNLALTAEELHRLDEIFAIGAGAGPRYPERTLRGVGL
jgi:aryl-alcohol dehydrogenase-like predicted oxidoreductase